MNTKTENIKRVCCFCGTIIDEDRSHDAWPLTEETFVGELDKPRCCSDCNDTIVQPARLAMEGGKA